MIRKTVKYIAASLAVLSCMSAVPQKVMADTANISLEESSSYTAHKDKKDKCKDEEKDKDKKKDDCKYKEEEKKKNTEKDKDKCKDDKRKEHGLEFFTDENCKYLSSDQKKTLDDCKKCKEKGTPLTEDQKKSLNVMIDCIIKGKLGDEKYNDFKHLMDSKGKGSKLTEDEEKKLKEYKNIIEGKDKTSAADILKQFLR